MAPLAGQLQRRAPEAARKVQLHRLEDQELHHLEVAGLAGDLQRAAAISSEDKPHGAMKGPNEAMEFPSNP